MDASKPTVAAAPISQYVPLSRCGVIAGKTEPASVQATRTASE